MGPGGRPNWGGASMSHWLSRPTTRRAALRMGLVSVASLTLAVACQQPAPPSPTAAPAAPPTSPPAAAKPTTGAPAAPGFPKVRINGKFTVVQSRDFHPDHNAFIERTIKEFAQAQ